MVIKYILEVEDKLFELVSEEFFRVKEFNSLVFDWNGLNMLTPYIEPDTEKIRKETYEQEYKKCFENNGKIYQRGFEDEKNRQWNCDNYMKDIYQRELNDVWECVKKIQDTGENLQWWIHNTSASEAIKKIWRKMKESQ